MPRLDQARRAGSILPSHHEDPSRRNRQAGAAALASSSYSWGRRPSSSPSTPEADPGMSPTDLGRGCQNGDAMLLPEQQPTPCAPLRVSMRPREHKLAKLLRQHVARRRYQPGATALASIPRHAQQPADPLFALERGATAARASGSGGEGRRRGVG